MTCSFFSLSKECAASFSASQMRLCDVYWLFLWSIPPFYMKIWRILGTALELFFCLLLFVYSPIYFWGSMAVRDIAIRLFISALQPPALVINHPKLENSLTISMEVDCSVFPLSISMNLVFSRLISRPISLLSLLSNSVHFLLVFCY